VISTTEELLQYYGKLDYPAVIAAQLNRVALIGTNLTYPPTKPDIFKYCRALLMLRAISPKNVRESVKIPEVCKELKAQLELDEVTMLLRDGLEKAGMLGVKVLEVGRPEVGVGSDANIHEESD